jgi:hypothetical protein
LTPQVNTPGRAFRFVLLTGNRANLLPCPKCGKRKFRPYLDKKTGEVLEDFGACNRAENCGFSRFPSEIIERDKALRALKHGEPLPPPLQVRTKPAEEFALPSETPRVQEVFWDWGAWHFFEGQSERAGLLGGWLRERFGPDTEDAIRERFTFNSYDFHGRIYEVFWHISLPANLHTAHLIEMRREGDRLKRAKVPGANLWLHKLPAFVEEAPEVWTQTLFGLPQLQTFKNLPPLKNPVRVVEGYRTAIVCSLYFPEFVWLGASSLQGLSLYSYTVCEPLRPYCIELFPDLSLQAVEEWTKHAEELRKRGYKCQVHRGLWDFVEAGGGPEKFGDIEDFLLQFTPEELGQRSTMRDELRGRFYL